MAAAQLIEYLNKTVSSNPADQTAALGFLQHAAEHNFPEYLSTLSEVLKAPEAEVGQVARQSAGLQLKNLLYSRELEVLQRNQQRCLALVMRSRTLSKPMFVLVMSALGTESNRPSIAAQCVAAIACIELGQGRWGEVITALMGNVTAGESTEMLREASLEAIGYICCDAIPEQLGARTNEILTAIVHGMRRQEPSDHVRLAATQALTNSLEFAEQNFNAENERHLIMQVVCEATQSQNTAVRVAALQCLVRILTLYYQHMEQYMAAALFSITLDAMKSQDENVVLQGVEFWSNVCDEEIELASEAEEAAEMGVPPENVSKFYAKGALQFIAPILTDILTRHDGNDDEDDWNPTKAAGVCVMLLAQSCGDDIVPVVLNFIQTNIQAAEWQKRDGAVMCFGSIMEGPDPAILKPLILQAMPILITLLQDANPVVKDTTAWCIGKICDVAPDTILLPDILQNLLPALSVALRDEPRVAANVCWAISSLALAAYEHAKDLTGHTDVSNEAPPTYILSSVFNAIVDELLRTTEREDASSSNLRNAAYESLMELIKNSPTDCYETG